MAIRKISQTPPTMASIVDTYNNSQTDSYSCKYSNEYYGGTILYNNPSGTSGNITLSDNISNYRYIEIYAINKDVTNEMLGIYKYDTTQSIFVLSGSGLSSTSFNIFSKKYTKGTNILTAGTGKLYSGGSGRVSDYEVYMITKVIGYK